jgi:hypothetical protein
MAAPPRAEYAWEHNVIQRAKDARRNFMAPHIEQNLPRRLAKRGLDVTMRRDAERESGPVWSSADDPRVTTIGRLLRRTHLDELPQLWNILRGEMSLVGPRPERAHFVAQFESVVPGYAERFGGLPGITGLSQIRSGYDESLRTVQRKIRYDRLYLRRACVGLDLKILLATVAHATGAARLSAFLLTGPRARVPAAAFRRLFDLRPAPPGMAKAPRLLGAGAWRRVGTGTSDPAAAGLG